MRFHDPARWLLTCAALLLLALACSAPRQDRPSDPHEARLTLLGFQPDLAIGEPPYETLEVNWKHRLDQPFVFIEVLGDPREFGNLLDQMIGTVIDQGIEPTGSPFALFYANPMEPLEGGLRMRACAPVAPGILAEPPLRYEVLPSTTVAYAFVAGPYPEVPLSYAKLFEFLDGMNWRPTGPAREVYFVSPAIVDDMSLLVTEVQIPAGPAAQ